MAEIALFALLGAGGCASPARTSQGGQDPVAAPAVSMSEPVPHPRGMVIPADEQGTHGVTLTTADEHVSVSAQRDARLAVSIPEAALTWVRLTLRDPNSRIVYSRRLPLSSDESLKTVVNDRGQQIDVVHPVSAHGAFALDIPLAGTSFAKGRRGAFLAELFVEGSIPTHVALSLEVNQ